MTRPFTPSVIGWQRPCSAFNPEGTLQPGLIFELARAAGVSVPERGSKRPIRCPFHDDKTASAFLSELNIFYCSVCTPDGGWPAKRFAEELRVPWNERRSMEPARPQPTVADPGFTADMARATWESALRRTRDDRFVDEDRAAYSYLAQREILSSWELCSFGVLGRGMPVPAPIAWWPSSIYRIVVPLYDQQGEIVNVQARAIVDSRDKTRFPKGARVMGTMFASPKAREMFAGSDNEHQVALLGEGLTDFLALVTATAIPVIAAPGTGFAAACIGPWVRGRTLLIALDLDDAGDAALPVVAREAHAQGASRVLRVEWPSPFKDACDVVAARGPEGLEAFLNQHLESCRG